MYAVQIRLKEYAAAWIQKHSSKTMTVNLEGIGRYLRGGYHRHEDSNPQAPQERHQNGVIKRRRGEKGIMRRGGG
jgi:hypothetical protein